MTGDKPPIDKDGQDKSALGGQLEHSGFVGVIGRPNVGKSTFLNTLARQKLAIVSHRPQTTRHTIRAVISSSGSQMVMIDTPGLHKPKDGLGERLNAKVRRTMTDVDVILFMLDGAAGIGRGDEFIARELAETKTPLVVCVNKTDLASPEQLDKELDAARSLLSGHEVLTISALTGDGVDRLTQVLVEQLPPGPRYYPENVLTDQPEIVLIGELIREKLIAATREELPYAVAVEVTEFSKRRRRDLHDIHARIHVERDSQKAIVIGKGGSVLEKVGRQAREEIESLLGSPVYLDLLVTVTKGWRRRERKVEEFGY